MKRLLAAALAMLVVAVACKPATEDQKALANAITRSSDLQHHFIYTEFSPDAAYRVDGVVQDDFRYSMTLSTIDDVPLVQEMVFDDALAVRVLRPDFAKALSNNLGHPTVDAALRAGKWVVDPAGAPPLIQPNATPGNETTGDPFRDARNSILYIQDSMSTSAGVKKFSLEDIAYRPLFDPWRYPTGREVRYDLQRPFLPKSAATNGSDQTITPAIFRKLSVFVVRSRIEESCEFVDIEGHEDIVALRQRGVNSNPYLRDLLKRIETKQTSNPITPKVALLRVTYPQTANFSLPKDAVIGKLTTFESAFLQAFTSGVLKPAAGQRVPRSCNRPHAKYI